MSGPETRTADRPNDVCALCDTPITDGPGFNGPARITVTWERGFLGRCRSAYAHDGCMILGDGRFDHLREGPFEETPLFELAASWARRTFARRWR